MISFWITYMVHGLISHSVSKVKVGTPKSCAYKFQAGIVSGESQPGGDVAIWELMTIRRGSPPLLQPMMLRRNVGP